MKRRIVCLLTWALFAQSVDAATMRWLGQATAVAQESRATPANVEIGDVFALKVGGVTMATYTAAAATVADVTAGLATAWNASTHPYATGVTASDQTTYLKLLADNAGVPFTVTSTATDGGGSNTQTLSITTPTANAGPNVWAADNFSGGVLPANSDTVIIENSAVPILWALDQSSVTLAELRVAQSFTGVIGLSDLALTTSVSGSTIAYDASKAEYRDTYLKISATALSIGQNVGTSDPGGSPRVKINVGSVQTAATVHNTGSASSDGTLQPVRLLGSHTSNALVVYGGIVGVATTSDSETSALATVYNDGGLVTLGRGAPWGVLTNRTGTLNVYGAPASSGSDFYNDRGTLNLYCGSTIDEAITNKGATTYVYGNPDITGMRVNGGTVYDRGLGTLGGIVDNGGIVDLRALHSAKSVTWAFRGGGGAVKYDPSIVTMTWGASAAEFPITVSAAPSE